MQQMGSPNTTRPAPLNGAAMKSPLLSKYFQAPVSSSPGQSPSIGSPGSMKNLVPAPFLPLRPPKRSFDTVNQAAVLQNGSLSSSRPSPSQPETSKIGPYNPQDYAPRGNVRSPIIAPPPIHSSPRETDGRPDTSKWGVKYNHAYPRSQDLRPKPILPPLRNAPTVENDDSTERLSAPTTPNTDSHALTDAETEGGYRLQPIAYSPNTQAKFDSDRQSWREGDDADKGLSDTQNQGPPKPPKILQDSRFQAAQNLKVGPEKPRTAPQLPPLFFEPRQNVEQKDFAYQNHPHTAGPLGVHTAQAVRQSPQIASAPLVPHPANRRTPSPTTAETEATNNVSEYETDRDDDESTQKGGFETPPRQNPMEEVLGPAGEGSTNSFYWHSPQSSADTTGNSSPKALEATDKSPTKNGKNAVAAASSLTSATVFGFGGPSDWEHFGDYQGEEVDDIALYVSNKPKTVELPATPSPVEEPQTQSTNPQSEQQPSEVLSGPVTLGDVDQLPPIQESLGSEAVEEKLYENLNATRSIPQIEEPPKSSDSPLRQSPAVSTENLLTSLNHRAVPGRIGDDPPNVASMVSTTTVVHVGPGDKYGGENPPMEPSFKDLKSGSSETAESDHENRNTEVAALDASAPAHDVSSHFDDESVEEEQSETRSVDEHNNVTGDGHGSASVSGTDNNAVYSPDVALKHVRRRITTDTEAGEDIIISLQVPESPLETRFDPMERTRERLDSARDSTPLTLTTSLEPTSPDKSRAGRRSMFPQFIELENPYANLDPWAKASLNRYVKMLRDEAQAETDEEKYMIFVNFTDRETRLRAVLYDMEEDHDSQHESQREQDHQPIPLNGSKRSLALRPSIRSKALPALPPVGDHIPSFLGQDPSLAEQTPRPHQRDDAFILEQSEFAQAIMDGKPLQARGPIEATSDESFVMVESPVDKSGTPLDKSAPIGPLNKMPSGPLKGTQSISSLRKALDLVTNNAANKGRQSPLTDRPASKAETDPKTDTVGPPSETPASVPGAEQSTSDIPADKTAYIPFKYNNEGRPYEGDKAANRQTIYRPFSMLLRQTSQRQSSLNEGLDRSKPPSIASRRSTIAISGPNGLPLPESLGAGIRPLTSTEEKAPVPPHYRYTILSPLLDVVPKTSVLRPESETVARLRQQMEAVQDDFSFIHATVLAWDGEAKQTREKREKERHARQGENEQRIDALFNENEIGYGDISDLEAEFKRNEASIKAAEDRAEFESFVSRVFDEVWARLHYEMDQLIPLYDVCTRLVNEASAGQEMFEDREKRVPIAPAMEILLILYQKLHVRHQKAFEAVLERDRRLKKTELAPWYSLGNMEKVKIIDKRFEDVEKKAILEFCRQRDERANLLMDVLDQNTLRGVGSNQDYMEAVMQAVRKIAMDVALGAVEEDALIATDEILKAKTITSALARSSEQIVQTFHVADMILNAADYEVSVANAKLSSADAASFRRLREAKAKEDQKLVKDLEHRMSLIRGDTSRTQDEISKLLSLITQAPPESPRGSDPTPADHKRDARMIKALEEAKRRNAQKEGAPI